MTDLRQTANYAQYLQSSGWLVEKTDNTYIFIRKIPLTPFSIIKVQRPEKIPFATISQLAKKHHTLAVYFEPLTTKQTMLASQHGFRLSKSPYLPTKTLTLDLKQSEEKILAQMKKDCRYAIKKAQNSSLQIIEVADLEKLHRVWKKSVNWQRYVPSFKNLQRLKKAFGKNALFLQANPPAGGSIAGTVILIAKKTAYYYYAFSSKTGRKVLAQYLLVWQAIKEAKKAGCQIFDFEGIYDKRFSNKSWLGFSHFKKSFGGKEVEYPGCFVNSRLRR